MALDFEDQRTSFLVDQAHELGMVIPDDISVDDLACAVDAYIHILDAGDDLQVQQLSFGHIGTDLDALLEEIAVAQKKIDALSVPIQLGQAEAKLMREALQHDRSKTQMKIYSQTGNAQSYYASLDFGNSRGMKFFAPRKKIGFKEVVLNGAKIQKQSIVG